jgi:hypothetical protein
MRFWTWIRGRDREWIQAAASVTEAVAVIAALAFTLWSTQTQLHGLSRQLEQGQDQLRLTQESLRLTQESLHQVQTELNSNAAVAVYANQLEVNKLMLDNKDLLPYFFEKRDLPKGNEKLRIQAGYVAGSILDFFEQVRYQAARGAFQVAESAWSAYIKESFATSPILCKQLKEKRDWYGGTEEGFLWSKYAKEPCEPWLTKGNSK